MNEVKLKKSFKLVKEDISDLYSKIEEISSKVDEMLMTQRTLADKIVGKADKRETKAVKKTSRKRG